MKLIHTIKQILMQALNLGWQGICRCFPLSGRVFFYTVRGSELSGNCKCVEELTEAEKVIFAKKLPHRFRDKPKIYYYLLTSRVIVTDDYLRYLRAVRLRRGQTVVQLWHAAGALKKFGLDAPSKLTEKEERRTHSQYSAVAVSSESCAPIYSSAFGLPQSRCLPLGTPRTDIYFNAEGSERLRTKTLEEYPRLKGKRIYLYCPTFREIKGERIRFCSRIDWSRLDSMLDDDELFVIHKHPTQENGLIEGRKYLRIFECSAEETALLACASVLVTDYSSIIFDAVLLGLPIVLYCPDFHEYERGFYLDFPTAVPADFTECADELPRLLRGAKNNSAKYNNFTELYLSACDGKAAPRCARLIENRLRHPLRR